MANTIRVVGVADMASMNAEFGKSAATLDKLGETANAVFTEMSAGALKAQLAADKLAISLARVPEGSTAAAAAISRYNTELETLAVSQTAAAREIGSTLTRYITVPTVLVGVAAVKLATDFQSAMLKIQTQAGASGTEVKNLSGQILDFAKSSAQQGPTTLANALFHLESLGLRGASAMDALEVSSKAAALGMADLSDTASALGGVIVTGIKGSSDYQKTMGTLNAIIGAGNMTMQGLLDALGTGLANSAKLAGVNLDEMGAALATLVDRGMAAQQAATRLGATFKLMIDPSPAAQKALADMGIGATTLAQDLQQPNGLLKALQTLQQGMQSVGGIRGAQDLASAFGRSRQSSAIITLVQSLDAAVSSYQSKVTQITDQTGKLTQSEVLQSKTASAQFHHDLAAMEADLIQLGDAMLPTVTAVVNGITKIGDAFSALPGPIKTELGAVVLLLAAGGPLLLAITGVVRAARSIGTAFGTAAAETTVATTTIEGEIAGIGTAAEVASTKVGLLGKVLGGLAAIAGLGYLDYSLGKQALTTQAINEGPETATPKGILKALYDAGFMGLSKSGQLPVGDGATELWRYLTKQQRAAYEEGAAAFRKAGSPNLFGGARVTPQMVEQVAAGALTPAQLMQIGLAENPNNPKLLAQERAQIQGTIDWLTRRFHEGKISSSEYTNQMVKLETQLHSIGVKTTTGKNKAAAEARKKAAASAKKQREYASGVSTTATELKTVADKYKTLPAGEHGTLPTKLTAADDDLIAYYDQEAKDANLTKAERARYAALAVQARQQEEAQAQKDADVYERTAVDTAKAAYQRVRRLKGDIAAKEQALRGEISTLTTAMHDKRLSPSERSTFIEGRGTAQGELAQLRNTYVSPLGIQLGLAKDTAMHDYTGMYAMALEEKKAALRAIKSGALGIQGMIDAWNVIDQANQTLQNWVVFKTVKSSAESLTAGLGLDRATRKALEMRIAQSRAHGGRLPTYEGVQGVAVPIHTHVLIDGREVATVVTAHQIKQSRHRPIQTRGLHAGT